MKKMKPRLIKRQRCLPLPRRNYLPNTHMTSEDIRVAQVIDAAQQEMELLEEIDRGVYPEVRRGY